MASSRHHRKVNSPMNTVRLFLLEFAAAALAVVAVPSAAKADILFSFSGTNGSDGAVSGTLDIAAGNGVLIVTVTNTFNASNGVDIGQGISSFNFTVANIAVPTAFAGLSGDVATLSASGGPPGIPYTLASGTTFSDTVSGNTDKHWSGISGSTSPQVGFGTAGSFAPGGQPTDLILPSSGGAYDGVGSHEPSLIGPTVFTLTDAGITSSTVLAVADFTHVQMGFGTGPDVTEDAGPGTNTDSPAIVPEPSTLIVAGLGALGFLGYGLRKRVKR
jgi:PEP-CTERM motif